MAYTQTIDERYAGTYVDYGADYYDASNLLNSYFRLAEGSTGYGYLTDGYTTADIDTYSMGVLSAGSYVVSVDDYLWDVSASNFGLISKFEVLNSYGGVVDTVYGAYQDISFNVSVADTYYVRVTGSAFGAKQYSLRYDATNANNLAVFTNATLTGVQRVGQTLTANINYGDADGILGASPYVYWYSGQTLVSHGQTTYQIQDTDFGNIIYFQVGFYDDLGNFELSAKYSIPDVTVAAENQAPTIIADDTYSAQEDRQFSLTFEGIDPESDPLLFSALKPSWITSIVYNGNNTATISGTPLNDDVGQNTITLYVKDSLGAETSKVITVDVVNVNDAPVATELSATTNEDTAISGNLVASDVDGDALTYVLVSDAVNGHVEIDAETGSYTYTPDANFNGSDSFEFKVNDETLESNIASINVSVFPVNDAPSFKSNGTGVVTLDFGSTWETVIDEKATSIGLQSDGKIITSGSTISTNSSTNSDIFIARFNDDGSLDYGFGDNGYVVKSLLNSDYAFDLEVLNDDSVLVAGYTYSGGANDGFAILKFNRDGSPDLSFGDNGVVITDFGWNAYGQSIDVMSDGRFVVAGYNYTSGGNDFAIAKYLPNGELDNTFSEDGKLIHAQFDKAYSVAVQDDGCILVGGNSGSNREIVICRYTQEGLLDSSFSSNGVFTRSTPYTVTAIHSIALQSDSKILAYDSSGSLLRLNSDGSYDNSFGTNGVVNITPFLRNPETYDGCEIVLKESDGIYLCGVNEYGESRISIAKFDMSGKLVSLYGAGGYSSPDTIIESIGYDSVIDANGKLVVAGYGNDNLSGNIVVARYSSDGCCRRPKTDHLNLGVPTQN